MSGEKTGDLEKMVYDFPTEAVLEVMIKEKWFRVTSREFRSFDSDRRYSMPIQQPGIGMPDVENLEFITIDYTGPLYMYGTNKEVHKTFNQKMVNSPYYESRLMESQSRK